MGAAEDPDVEDYYDKSRSFPVTYSPGDDPEVIEDMRVAAAELEASDDDNEDGEDGNESSDDSSESDGSGSQADGQNDGDEGWEDDEDEGGTTTQSKGRKRPKVMSVIEKVQSRSIPPSLSLLIEIRHP